MKIHWFPGHMTKALRMLESELKAVDIIIYVLDARAPFACLSPSFDNLIAKRPVVFVLNKSDMIEKSDLVKIIKHFENQGKIVVSSNSVQKNDKDAVLSAVERISQPIRERYKLKGVEKTIRAMVVGVPNSGKSTLINSLIKTKKVVTGNKPGVTRGKQWVQVASHLELLDSPGVTYPDFSDEDKSLKLAILGSIKEDILDLGELGYEFVYLLQQNYAQNLSDRYGIDIEGLSTLEILEAIGKSRGVQQLRGEVDYDRIAKLLLTDFRKGYLGKICLESLDE